MIIAQCPVCQELLESGTNDCCLSALHCGHVFHTVCIDTWLKTSSTCPQCRLSIARRQTIKRLYFCLVDRASTSVLLPELSISITEDKNLQYSPSKEASHSNSASVAIALKKARSEIVRLTNQVSALKEQLETISKKLAEKDEKLDSMNLLYKEVEKLYTNELQKCKQAKLELSGYKKVLQEAENIKSEGLELRRQMNEMRDLQTLIGSSEKAANELLFRYTGQTSANPSHPSETSETSLITVCRWATVLRSELSSARSKCRQYRGEVHRLQKMQATSARRVLAAESTAVEQKERARHLQNELAQLRTKVNPRLFKSKSSSSADHTQTIDVSNSRDALFSTPIRSDNNQTSTSFSTDDLGLRSCLAYVDLPTPEFSALLATANKQFSPVNFAINPFKMSNSLASTPETVGKLLKHSQMESDPASDQMKESEDIKNRRRPSSLFQLAIMRNYKSAIKDSSCPYNGLGGQQEMRSETNVSRQEYSTKHKQIPHSSKQRCIRNYKKSINIPRISTKSKLDNFLRPL